MEVQKCRFCEIIKGILPASFVFRSSRIVVFMDKFPITEGHLLVVPTAHYENIFDIPEDLLSETMRMARKTAIAAKSALDNVTGVTILQNNGDSAGQRIFHFHIHVIPRTNGSLNRSRFTSSRNEVEKEVLDEIAARIDANLH
jgi:diadenosine tetraphosphate (Ap4A) HIT family hydrolase